MTVVSRTDTDTSDGNAGTGRRSGRRPRPGALADVRQPVGPPARRRAPFRRAGGRAGPRARRHPRRDPRQARRLRRRLHPPRDQDPAQSGDRRPRRPAVSQQQGRLGRRHHDAEPRQDPRKHGDRPQRPARPVGLDARPRHPLHHLGVGLRHPAALLAAHPQRPAPPLDQRGGQGQRRRLLPAAHGRGPAVEARTTSATRCTTRSWPRSSNGASPSTTSSSTDYKEGKKSKEDLGKDLKALGMQGRSRSSPRTTPPPRPSPCSPAPASRPSIGTLTANAIRNVWAHAVIFCGHFPDGADTFTEEMVEGETRGDWYVRQMIGSANISGSKFMHLMTGNLSPPDRAPPLPGPAVQPVRRGGRRRSARSASATACRTPPARC